MKQLKTNGIDFITIAALHQMNPWWEGNAMEQLPETRRHLVAQIEKRFEYKLAPITVVRGSRQVGKTTACLHVISDLLAAGVAPKRILRIQLHTEQRHLSNYKRCREFRRTYHYHSA